MTSFSIFNWIIVGAIGFVIYSVLKAGRSGKPMVCKACGHQGSGSTKTRGNILIEIILWLCLIIPGLIYSLWRLGSRHKVCAVCGSTELIPIDSPIGKKLIEESAKPSA